jgi:hypothetical protein
MGDTKEWARNGSFMKKPTSGWLHDDAALNNGDGVYYPVKVKYRYKFSNETFEKEK